MAKYLVYSSGSLAKFVVALQIISDEIREPTNIESQPIDLPPFYVIFEPDLTANEQTKLANIISKLDDAISDYGQLGQIRSDVQDAKAALTTYYNLASPTAAQTVAAVKKIIEVLNLFLRLLIILLDYIRFKR